MAARSRGRSGDAEAPVAVHQIDLTGGRSYGVEISRPIRLMCDLEVLGFPSGIEPDAARAGTCK